MTFQDLKMRLRWELLKISKIAFSKYVLGLLSPAGWTRFKKCKKSKIEVPYCAACCGEASDASFCDASCRGEACCRAVCCLLWCILSWCGLLWCSLYNLLWCRLKWCSLLWYSHHDAVCYSAACCGEASHGETCCGVACYGVACYGSACCGHPVTVQPIVVLLAWCSLLWFCLIGGGGGPLRLPWFLERYRYRPCTIPHFQCCGSGFIFKDPG